MAEYPFLSEFRIYPLPLAGLGGLPGTQRLERLHPRSLLFPSRPPPHGDGKIACVHRVTIV